MIQPYGDDVPVPTSGSTRPPVARNSTLVTPTLSARRRVQHGAFPLIAAPLLDGTMIAVVGAVRSTVIVIGALVVVLPAASNATLCSVYVPSATAIGVPDEDPAVRVLVPVPSSVFDRLRRSLGTRPG